MENIVRTGEIACNKQFLLFAECFLPYMALIFHFKCSLKCCLQFVPFWTSLKFCRLVMVNYMQSTEVIIKYICDVYFMQSASEVPSGYRLQYVHGFVEELVVNDDPEYQWIDKIRTPRSSNEARQRLFSKMSGNDMLELTDRLNGVLHYFQHYFKQLIFSCLPVLGLGSEVSC